jgi:hypothetical protein
MIDITARPPPQGSLGPNRPHRMICPWLHRTPLNLPHHDVSLPLTS